MKIKRIVSQHRDFRAIYECDHCGHETGERVGYDDDHFHRNVIPAMECPDCGKTAGEDYRPLAPKYPDHVQLQLRRGETMPTYHLRCTATILCEHTLTAESEDAAKEIVKQRLAQGVFGDVTDVLDTSPPHVVATIGNDDDAV